MLSRQCRHQESAAGTAEELLKQATVSREGNTVVSNRKEMARRCLPPQASHCPELPKAREAATASNSMNNLKQLAIAMMAYQDQHGHLPPAVVMGPDGKTPHSWRVEVLPYLEHAEPIQAIQNE